MACLTGRMSSLLLVLACTAIQLGQAQTATNADVIVIGAGISGIAAARRLVKGGVKNVILLEANKRKGGRLYTVSLRNNVKIDAGGAWIQGVGGNPLYALAKEFGLTLGETEEATTYYDVNNKKIADGLGGAEEVAYDFAARWILAEQESGRFTKATTVQQAFDRYMATEADPLNPSQLRKLRAALRSLVETEYAADMSQLSALYFGQDEAPDDRALLWKDGYGSLVEVLAQGLDIRTGKQVTSIDYSGASVVVKTASGEEWTAPYVICTLPLGVLKSRTAPKFIPALPQDKQTAIKSLGVGLLNKVVLQFNTAFWASEANTDWINTITFTAGNWSDIVSLHRTFKEPVLVFLASGGFAQKQESFTNEVVVKSVTGRLKRMFPRTYEEPIYTLVTRWSRAPFALGSYSYIKAGGDPSAYIALSQPVNNKLFFAGEATNQKYPATAHGALLSGEREADNILKLLPK